MARYSTGSDSDRVVFIRWAYNGKTTRSLSLPVLYQLTALARSQSPRAQIGMLRELRRTALLGCLLKGKSKLDQLRLAPRLSRKRDAYGQAKDETCRDGDVWITRYRGRRGEAAREMI